MRRRCKSGTEHPLTTALRYSERIRRSSEKPFDMREPKRVRFLDGELEGVPVHDSSERCEATQSPRSDAPKTSEFAYFRKVKSGAVHGHSRSLRDENGKLKSSKINRLITEASGAFGMHKPITRDLKISVSGERAGPFHKLFVSPRVSKYDEPDQRKVTDKCEKRSALLCENVIPVGQIPFTSPPHEASENSENEYSEREIFSEKRHRLHQWATHTLSSDVETVRTKGFDFVSALMSRLFPKNKENNSDLSKGETDNSSKSLTVYTSNNLEKGIHLSHNRDSDKDIPKISSGRPNEIILPELDTFVSSTESRAEDILTQHLTSRTYRSSHTHNDYSFCVPFERHKSADSFCFKGLDDYGSITDHPGEELHRPLLEWDFEWSRNDRMDSFVFNHDPSRNVDQMRFTDNVVNTKGSCSLFSNYFLEPDSLPSTHDFGPKFDDVKCALTEPGQFITLREDRNEEESIRCHQNIFFSYGDQHWLKNNVWDRKPQSDFLQEYLSASDFSADDYASIFHARQFSRNESSLFPLSRRLNESSPISEGTFYCNFLSSNFQSSPDALISHPLLLNHRSDQELYFDYDDDNNNDNELKYI